ncbi:hypothetical protein H5410_006874 [Solanum commersonii]|uniref:Uncharacterized protein n=1 Tax=Solanum commersonii TaxID=4109 RepID=A0A9J6AAZ1_SOLCO|nr:hypothetical protein H5410_006874 [Solanum commersonii]
MKRIISAFYNSYIQECHIKAVMYADEIEQYADKLTFMDTYLISTTRIKVSPSSYGKPIRKFYWVLDKELNMSNHLMNLRNRFHHQPS